MCSLIKQIKVLKFGWVIWAKQSLKIPIIPCTSLRFFAITQPFFGQSGWNFYGNSAQETIIHRLVLKNPGFGPYLPFSILGLKMCVAPQIPTRVWDLKPQPKSWPTWRTFWVTCYLEIVFSTFLTLDPLPPLINWTKTTLTIRTLWKLFWHLFCYSPAIESPATRCCATKLAKQTSPKLSGTIDNDSGFFSS